MKQYIVDAFTSEVFKGNPAAVCVLDKFLPDDLMIKIAAENNLSETAFAVREGGGYRLRWFTPTAEIGLCGHATLASAYVITGFYEKGADEVIFYTVSGKLTVKRKNDVYEMDFPSYKLTETEVTDDMERAFGVRPEKALTGLDLVCVFGNPSQVKNMKPDQKLLARLAGRAQHATALGGDGVDCVSRSFAPKLGIAEDPVCGSAHCQIAEYWASVLGKNDITAYQASRRGGTLYCHTAHDGRITLSGKAALFAVSEIMI